MSPDTMLAAGWPAHYATYTGRTYEAIRAEMLPIEERMVWDEPVRGDELQYAELCAEWRAHPITMDEAQASAARLTRLLEDGP